MKKFVYILSFLILCFSLSSLNAQGFFKSSDGSIRSAEQGFAEEEFRRGVQSYYRGAFNDAIVQFEKSLSYLPDENLIMDWLGKAYYKAGLEGAALKQWQYALDSGYGGVLLENRIEVVRERRVTGLSYEAQMRYTETGCFPGKANDTLFFSQPICALPNVDGTMWVLSYGTNELLCFDVNGTITSRVTGPLNGFDRPVDIIRLSSGNILVSESSGDRLALLNPNGGFEKYIGKKGRGQGELIGPQYLAEDSYGNIYVTDFGNSRVTVFDKDGNGIFSFGTRQAGFVGLKGPTGIAIDGERIFVADCVAGAIYEFDLSGNYIDILCEEKTFAFPEALRYSNGNLIVSDRERIVSVDIQNGILFENARTSTKPSRVTSAVPDMNGNIIVTDFMSNDIFILSKMTELVGGLFVEIENVNASKFPHVVVDVKVQNRKRQPIVGLREQNFVFSEDKRQVSNVKFEGAASENKIEDITIVIDRSIESDAYKEGLERAVRELAASMDERSLVRVVSSSDVPVLEYKGSPKGLINFSSSALKAKTSDKPSFDLALRLSVNDLINAEMKRAVVYITNGSMTENSFDRYGMSDLTSYMNNNNVAFSVVLLSKATPAEELQYISSNTNGKSYYVYRPQGLKEVITDLLNVPNGMYRFSYTSTLPTDLGRAYLPVEVETYMLNRSGRDETGYFSPLQ